MGNIIWSAVNSCNLPVAISLFPDLSIARVPVSLLHLILFLLFVSLVVSVVIFLFSRKLKKLNRALEEKNRKVEEINKGLKETTLNLSSQKEEIRKELSETENFFRTLIHAADDGISFYDETWALKFANKAFYSILGLDKENYHSQDPQSFLHPDDKDFVEQRNRGLMENGVYEGEFRLRHAEGHYLTLSTRSVVIRDDSGEIKGYFSISRDITNLKKIHEDLVKARVEAETSNKLKASFLANISHEIRTPLNSVVGFANLLLADNLPLSAREEFIEHINWNSEKLLQIIGDIIDLSRLESSQIEITYEETSLENLVKEVVDEARKSIKRNEKPIILTVRDNFEGAGDLIFTDRLWLKRVLNHLLDNAVKFTLEGSVELTYSIEDGNIVFRIKDTGIGIRKENLNTIFEGFRQEMDGHQRPFEGLGVGLTLAREVVKKMGGKILVRSEKGIGSEFTFYVPFRQAGSSRLKNRAPFRETGTLDWSSRKCLLVDDNRDVLIYLSRILLDTGISIVQARSGSEAIESIRKNSDIDVVVLDMQMPEMNGIEVTREIRKIRGNLPIIAQTAFIFENDKDLVLEAGCDACLIKPIRKEHLLTVMSGFIGKP